MTPDPEEKPGRPVALLYSARDAEEAALLVQALQSQRIPLSYTGGHASAGFGELPADARQVAIYVPAEFLEQGRRVLIEQQQRARISRLPGSEWDCAGCGETNAHSFEVCWSCHDPRRPAASGGR